MRYLLFVVAACGSTAVPSHSPPPAGEGAIVGLARDHDSGDVVAKAQIHIRPQGQIAPLATITNHDGNFGMAHLAPGKYSLTASFGGQNVDVHSIDVTSGAPTVVDVMFTLGQPDPITVEFGDPKESAIDHYKHGHALIEGTISNRLNHERVVGAVITAVGPGVGPMVPTLQAVSDDQGRYRFDPVPPGIYVVSAYYGIEERGQIEVRRSDIEVPDHEGVIVPLWVETER
ncbi:MAG: carboxypeptidase-like regulatory domain-containing protein [Kofleriaceae bacterium]